MVTFKSIPLYGIGILISLFLTGCFAVYTDNPEKYDIAYDKNKYATTEEFSRVFVLLAESSGWEFETEAVVFDFKDDDIALTPRGQQWRVVESAGTLGKIMHGVDIDTMKAVSVKPCSDCRRIAAGAVFSAENIVFKYDREESRVSFFKGRDSSAGSPGGGGSGGGCG